MSKLRILDFDIENRPLAYMGEDYTSGEITAIAATFIGENTPIWTGLLGRDPYKEILEGFRKLYDAADIVTGHYIREHDLPIINGAMVESHLPCLSPKTTIDTKIDLVKHKYLSASQENLCAALGIPAEKVHMSNALWREANRLTTEGLALTYSRVVGDVIQHMALLRRLRELKYLGAPKTWRP